MPDAPLCCVTVAGSMIMAEQANPFRLLDPDVDTFFENTGDDRIAPYRVAARTDAYPEESVRLFLSDQNGEPDPIEYLNPLRKKRKASISSLILVSVLAAAAAAVLFALFSSDATRDIAANFKASIAAVLPAPSAAAQSDPSQLTQRDRKLNEPAQPSTPDNQTVGVRTVTTAAVVPTREEIKNAYQSALQSGSARQKSAPVEAAAPEPLGPTATPHT